LIGAAVLSIAAASAHAQAQPSSMGECLAWAYAGVGCDALKPGSQYRPMPQEPAQWTPPAQPAPVPYVPVDLCADVERFVTRAARDAAGGASREDLLDQANRVTSDMSQADRSWFISAAKAAYVRNKEGLPAKRIVSLVVGDCRKNSQPQANDALNRYARK